MKLETLKDVLASARDGLDPSPAERARVRRRVLRRAAAFGALGTATAVKSAAASTTAGGSGAATAAASYSFVALAKAFASTFVLSAAGATAVVVGVESVTLRSLTSPSAPVHVPSHATEAAPRAGTTTQGRAATQGPAASSSRAPERAPLEPEPERHAVQPVAERSPRAQANTKQTDALPADPASSAGDLQGEFLLLQRAREAATAGRTQQARQLLAELDRRYSVGLFLEERSALRVVTTCPGAPEALRARLATQFLTAYPRSVYAARVRLACGTPANSTDSTSSHTAPRQPLTDRPLRGH